MKHLLVALILLTGLSCTSKRNEGDYKVIKGSSKVLEINTKNLSIDYRHCFSEICDSIWYVQLESTKESMFGEMNRVFIDDQFIIIADLSVTKEVFVFDRNGKYISKISKIGEGPFEYDRIADICYWPQTKSIFIFDDNRKKVIEYELTGKPIREFSLPFTAQSMALIDHHTFAFYVGFRENVGLKYNLIVVNEKGKIVRKAFPMDDRITSPCSKDRPFYQLDEKLFFAPDYDDHIYCVTKDSISYRYTIDFMGKNVPPDLIFNKESKEYDKEISKNDYVYYDLQFESENYFFARIVAKDFNYFQYIYSKKEKKGIIINNLIYDIPNSFVSPNFIGNVGDVFYGPLESEFLLFVKGELLKDHTKFPENQIILNQILSYKETDNPIMCFCRMNLSRKSKINKDE